MCDGACNGPILGGSDLGRGIVSVRTHDMNFYHVGYDPVSEGIVARKKICILRNSTIDRSDFWKSIPFVSVDK